MTNPNNNSPALCWSTYNMFGPGGYAEEGRSFILALEGSGVRVGAESLDGSPGLLDLGPEVSQRLKVIQNNKLPRSVPKVHNLFPHHFRPEEGRVNIVRTMLESDRIPACWVEALKDADEVWVPSEFNIKTFAASGVDIDKIRVVHDPLSPAFQDTRHQGRFSLKNNKGFRFLSLFWDWSLRKGWDILLEAYFREFKRRDDVVLVLKTGPAAGIYGERPDIFADRYLKESVGHGLAGGPEIEFITEPVSSNALPNLYSACDSFVLPSRGEGWGRPYMEGMATGLPVIGTGWGGNTEFMDAENSFLLDAPLVNIPEQGWLEGYFLTGKWAEPSVEELRSIMRKVFEDRDGARKIGKVGQDHILKLCDPARVANTVKERISALTTIGPRSGSFTKKEVRAYRVEFPSNGSPAVVAESLTLNDLGPRLKTMKAERLLLYGTGKAARQVMEKIEDGGASVSAFIDREGDRTFLGRPVIEIGQINLSHFEEIDMVILAAYPAVYRRVKERLIKAGCAIPILPLIVFYEL